MEIDKTKKIWEQITLDKWHKGSSWGNNKQNVMLAEQATSACALSWLCLRYAAAEAKLILDRDWYINFKKLNNIECLPHWNDDPKRKFHEVQQAFKKADL